MTDFKNQLDLYLKELENYMDGKLADCPSLEVDHVKVYINNSLAEEINRKKVYTENTLVHLNMAMLVTEGGLMEYVPYIKETEEYMKEQKGH